MFFSSSFYEQFFFYASEKRFNGLYTPLVDVYILLKVALLRAADFLTSLLHHKIKEGLIVPKSVFLKPL